MLGNPVSAESLLAMNEGQQLVEEDATEATEHARQLVEDCRRMLLGATELPMGSWGLINADPEYAHIRIKFSNIFLFIKQKNFRHENFDSNQLNFDLFSERETRMKQKWIPFSC